VQALERGDKPIDFPKATMPSRQMELPSLRSFNEERRKMINRRKKAYVIKASKIYQRKDGSADEKKIAQIWNMLIQRLDPLIVSNEGDDQYMDRSEWLELASLDEDYMEIVTSDEDQFAMVVNTVADKFMAKKWSHMDKDGNKVLWTRQEVIGRMMKVYKTDIKRFWEVAKKYAPGAVHEYETSGIEDLELGEPEPEEVQPIPKAVAKAEAEPEEIKPEYTKDTVASHLKHKLEKAKEAGDVKEIDKLKALLNELGKTDFDDFISKYDTDIMKEHHYPPVHMMLEAIRKNVPSVTIHALANRYAKIGHISGVIDIYESTLTYIYNVSNCHPSDLVAMICESTRKMYCDWEQPWSVN
jgi:hypothetical protein